MYRCVISMSSVGSELKPGSLRGVGSAFYLYCYGFVDSDTTLEGPVDNVPHQKLLRTLLSPKIWKVLAAIRFESCV